MEGLQASLILLAKRMGWDTTYRQLLCHKLIPLVDEWKAGAVSDRTIVEVIIIMGMFDEDNLKWRTEYNCDYQCCPGLHVSCLWRKLSNRVEA
jgi:hypothetical protein